MPLPQAFIAIEKTMASAMHVQWDALAKEIMGKVNELVEKRDWAGAHALADQLTLQGVVTEVRPKLHEMAVAAKLFGAHHVAGSVKATSFAQGDPLPKEMQTALDQLETMVEQDAADYVRNQLHAMITKLQQKDETTHFQKDDISEEQLEETGGLMEPDQGGKRKKTKKGDLKTLYVRRDLVNAQELHAWALTQGFKTVLPQEDMHVTVCYSKALVDWNAIEPAEGRLDVPEHAGDREIAVFGEAIVLTFDSDELQRDHAAFREDGASFDFDEYQPHVTISYGELPDHPVEPYRGPLVFGPEIFQEIKPGWADDLEETELRKAEKALHEMLNDAVLNGGKVAIDVGANLTTSRLVSFGFLAEATKSGVDEYQINEVLDTKTCPVCQYMHGKTFRVQNEYGRLLQALSTSDPQELKTISPWPSQSKAGLKDLYDMDPGEMQGAGYGSPPFHPGCRGMLVQVGEVSENVPLGGPRDEEDDDKLTTLTIDGLSDAADAVEADTAWEGERVDELDAAIDEIEDEDLKDQAREAFDAGDYETTLSIAEEADEQAAADAAADEAMDTAKDIWSQDEIDALGWERFDVTDPDAFSQIDDAYDDGDYDKAEALLTKWKKANGVTKDDTPEAAEDNYGPNAGKKKRKAQQRADRAQDYNDIKPDSSNVAFDAGTSDDSTAPLDRN